MRLYLSQLAAHLAAGPKAGYLIFGDEPFLCQEASDLILNAVTHAGVDVQRIQIEKGFGWESLLQDLQTVDLFAPQKVMVVTLLQKPDAATTKGLTTLFEQLPQGYTLIVVGHCRLTKAQLNAKWFTTLEKQSVYIPTNAPEGVHLQRWMQHRLQQERIQVTPEALEWMCLAFSGNLATAYNEIKKLSCMQLPLPLDRQNLMQHVTSWSHFSAFDWIDALLLGDVKRGLTLLASLRQDEQEPNLLLWAATQEMERFAQIEQLAAQGLKPAQIGAQLKIWNSRMPVYDRAHQRLTQDKRCDIWRTLQLADDAYSAFDKDKTWQLLQHLTVLFSQDIKFSLHL